MERARLQVGSLILVLGLSAASLAKASGPMHPHVPAPGPNTRLVIGALVDVSVDYVHGKPVTVIHILEFGPREFPDPPEFLQVRLCGDYGQEFAQDVHTNVSVRYKLASASRSIDCLRVMSVTPWEEGSERYAIESIGMPPLHHRSAAKVIRRLIHTRD